MEFEIKDNHNGAEYLCFAEQKTVQSITTFEVTVTPTEETHIRLGISTLRKYVFGYNATAHTWIITNEVPSLFEGMEEAISAKIE